MSFYDYLYTIKTFYSIFQIGLIGNSRSVLLIHWSDCSS